MQASSPDEIALVEFGESLGYLLEHKDNKNIILRNPKDIQEQYTILENFPFSPETKRMGLVMKDDNQGTIHFFLKGADSVMIPMLDEGIASMIQENCDNLAKQGLRTLVMCSKIFTEEEYQAWKSKFEEAGKDHQNREEREKEVIQQLECGIKLLCVTGVEDLLQDDIKEVIENLRAAGIRVWMLTGNHFL